jgi:hypothetical protein
MRTTATRIFIFCLLAAVLLTPTLLAANTTPSPASPLTGWLTDFLNFLVEQAGCVLSIPQG